LILFVGGVRWRYGEKKKFVKMVGELGVVE
jgi:hypothetical protein